MNLIAKGLLALLRHPDQLAQLRDDNIDPSVATDETLPGLRLAAQPQWRDTFVLRGLTTLPVTWRT